MRSKGMLKTKSFKLDKPKKGDGWEKIVEWHRRWNKILSVIFGILSFSLLFAIVLANIIHTDYKNYDIVTTTSTTTSTTSTTTTEEPPSTTKEVPYTTVEPPTTTGIMPTEGPDETVDSTTEIPYTTTTTAPDTSTGTQLWTTTFATPPWITDTDSPETTTKLEPPLVGDHTTTTTSTTFNTFMTTTSTTSAFTLQNLVSNETSLQSAVQPNNSDEITAIITDTTTPTEASSSVFCVSDQHMCVRDCCKIYYLSCIIQCEYCSGYEEYTSASIVALSKLCFANTTSMILLLHHCRFRTNTIRENWLDVNFNVRRLVITAPLEAIEANAFNLLVLSEMEELCFSDLTIAHLQRSAFVGLSKLIKLEFHNCQLQVIDGDTFGELIELEVLNIFNSASQILVHSITGGATYSKLRAVVFTGSKIVTIGPDSFVGVPNLETLLLDNAAIVSIDAHAFRGASGKLYEIDLRGNYLTSIEAGLFDYIVRRDTLRIYLEGNPWECDCKLMYLHALLADEAMVDKFPGNLNCYSPAIRDAQVDYDCTSPTPLVSTTDKYNTPTDPGRVTPSQETSNFPDDLTPSVPSYRCPRYDDSDEVFNPELKIPFEGGHRFNLTEISEGTVLVQIHPDRNEYMNLFWFLNSGLEFHSGSSHERQLHCRPDIEESVTVSDLISNAIYLFCMVPITRDVLTPFDCLSISMTPSVADRPWLMNKDRLTAYMIFCSATFIMFLLGALLACFCIRRHPNAFRRNTVKSSKLAHDMMFMPPLPKRNPTMTHKKPLRRSISDASLASGRSYVSAINPSPFEIIAWKMDRTRFEAQHRFYNLEKLPDNPPPIPPPKRPSDTSHYSNLDEIYPPSARSRRTSTTTGYGSGKDYFHYHVYN